MVTRSEFVLSNSFLLERIFYYKKTAKMEERKMSEGKMNERVENALKIGYVLKMYFVV